MSNCNIIRIIAIAIIASMLISYPLWCNQNGFISVGFSLGIEPFFLLFTCLAAIIFFPEKKYLYFIFIFILVLCLSANFTRIQIWLFHLSGILCLIGLSKKQQPDLIRICIAAAYIWGGFNKLNPWFAEFQLDWLLEKPALLSPFRYSIVVGYGIGLIEFILGILLIFNKLPKIVLAGAIFMHSFILLLISPLGLDWNYVVIPWNITLIILNIYLFQTRNEQFWRNFTPFHYIAFGLFLVFPSLQYFGIGERPLSFNMYAADQLEGTLFFHENELPKFDSIVRKDIYYLENQQNKLCYLKLQDWAMHSLNVPAYAEKWAMKVYAKSFCKTLQMPDSAGIEILSVSHWRLNSAKNEQFHCADLK